MRNRQSKQGGFTIIEVIVVIVVLGILATIGIVSYGSTQNRAKRNSFQSNAEQVKLKLGEYFTEKRHYYLTKAEVAQYLGDIGSSTLKTEFEKSAYQYSASGDGGASCVTDGPTYCTSYTITVPKTNWQGSSSETDITVQP